MTLICLFFTCSITHLSRMKLKFSILINWTSLFPLNGIWVVFFILVQILIQHAVNKQWRPRACAAIFDVWSKLNEQILFQFYCYRFVGKVIERVNAKKTTFILFSFKYPLIASSVIIFIDFCNDNLFLSSQY